MLVQVDMSGNFAPGRSLPKFVKKYGNVWDECFKAISDYKAEVKSREYPAVDHTYPLPKEELQEFEKLVSGY